MLMSEFFILIGGIAITTTNWGNEGAITCMIWAICQAIDTIGWILEWVCYLDAKRLTIIDKFSYGVIGGLIMVILSHQTFFMAD